MKHLLKKSSEIIGKHKLEDILGWSYLLVFFLILQIGSYTDRNVPKEAQVVRVR